MTRYKTKHCRDACLAFFTTSLLILTTALLPANSNLAEGNTTETLEWDVSAECQPHAEIKGPLAMSVLFIPQTSRTETAGFSATMHPNSSPIQNSIDHRWDYPYKGWHSVLFEGPPIQTRFFCQDVSPTKNLLVSYEPDQMVEISLGQSATFGAAKELDTIGSTAKKSYITVAAEPSAPFYYAGKDTKNPYWLTFSIPTHSPHDIKTTVKYEFP